MNLFLAPSRRFTSILVLSLASLAGCGSGPHVRNIISPSAAQYIDAGQSVTFTSQVYNDPQEAGVTFQLIADTSSPTNPIGTLTQIDKYNAVYTADPKATSAFTDSVFAVPVDNALTGASTTIFLAPAPVITTLTLPATTAGTPYSQQIASTGGTAPLAWKLSSGTLPAGITLSATGLLSGAATTPGSYTFSISLTDSATTPVTSTLNYTLLVNPAALVITSSTLPTGIVTKPYSTTLTAAGGTLPYTWALYSGTLPGGLTLSAAGVISGLPTTAGNFTFTVQITDSGAPTPQVVRKTLSITVYNVLSITTTSLPDGAIKDAYTATLQAAGGNNSYGWTLVSGSLPAGLSLSPGGTITGTPTATGTSTFTVQVADTATPQQTATATLTINIVLSTLAITTTSLPQVTVNSSYNATLTSSGGNPPITWALAAGSNPLPPTLTLSSAGVISGTATTVGTYSFTVQASDTTPASVTKVLSITVVPLTTLSVTTSSLPAGNIGTPYTTTLAATGGATPYTWTLASGTLPLGLTLSAAGVISGTPYVATTSSFTVQVKDSQPTPAVATRLLSLTIGTTLANGPNDSLLSGSYAFLLNGFNPGSTSGAVYGFGVIGSLKFDTAGNVTGIEDINTPTGAQQSQTVTGTYTIGTDDRGLMVLTAAGNTIVYSIAVGNIQFGIAQSIALAEFDASSATGSIATGYAKLQTPAAFTAATLTGSFTFGLQGESVCSTCATPAPRFGPVAVAGFFTGNGITTISTGLEDASAYGQNVSSVAVAGTFTTPSTTTGRGTLILTPAASTFSAPPVDYTYVIVNSNELLLLSTDSHATNALLYGDALLQQNSPYTAASLTGRSIGYESQAAGGDGSITLPPSLNAILYNLSITGSGTASLVQDANRAGTVTTGTTSATYTTAANGRTAITTNATSNQVVYLDATGAGFGIDLAPTSGYPALIQYELQVSANSLPPLVIGTCEFGTLLTPRPAPTTTGAATYKLASGGVNSEIGGQISLITDSDTPAGNILYAQTATQNYIEDTTGRQELFVGSAETAVSDVISAQRAVTIPITTGTTPTVTVTQK